MSLADILEQSNGEIILPAVPWSNFSVNSINAPVINTDTLIRTIPFQQIGGMFELVTDLVCNSGSLLTGFEQLEVGGWASADNSFNQSTGVFTAPMKGKYMFTVNLLCNNASQVYLYPRINSNKAIALEATIIMGQIIYSDLTVPTFSPPVNTDNRLATIKSTFIFDLTANDTVDFRVESQDTLPTTFFLYAYNTLPLLGSTSTLSIALVGLD
jgi:hypothetical protein